MVAAPPFRTVVPRNQPFALERDMIRRSDALGCPTRDAIGKSRCGFPLWLSDLVAASQSLRVMRVLVYHFKVAFRWSA